MSDLKINKITDLHDIFMGIRSHEGMGWWFRGQSNINWELRPKAGRSEYILPDNRDLGRFKHWRNQAIAYNKDLPENDWECLAIAQHYGLATRLLDWTYNPLIATFFAANENHDIDGVIYCYQPLKFVKTDVLKLDSPSNGFGFIPRVLSPRILNQKSLFSVHSPVKVNIIIENVPFLVDTLNLFRIIIPKGLKNSLQVHIADYGFTYSNIFPDLEGLSRHVNWDTKGMVKYRNNK